MYEQLCAILDALAARGYAPQVLLDSKGIAFRFRQVKKVQVDHGILKLDPEKAAQVILDDMEKALTGVEDD